ncbi:MAG: lipid A biosynthesis (KDO)2-(lauroyl)-lipid IVA acyltransferase [Bacteroidales bacterium]|nr:lipid A biosynthesis (KDO)2-(lauroyl)-lipid IVA acyltransferase [Bacteroidales bacterium]
MKKQAWKGVTGGNVWGQKALLVLFRVTGITAGYALMATAVPFYMLFHRQGYLSIYRYFRVHFRCAPFRAFLKTCRNHFIFGQCLLDRFFLYAGRRGFFSLEITGNELFEELAEGEKGFIIAGSHVGNFELCGYLLQQHRKHIHCLVYGGETRVIMENRRKILQKNHVSMIPVADDLSHVFAVGNALSHGDAVCIPCDRTPANVKSTVLCRFLEGKAEFPLGAFSLAALFDVPVLAIFVMKESVSKYHVYVRSISGDATDVSGREKAVKYAETFAKELENTVKMYPEQWFNYYAFFA